MTIDNHDAKVFTDDIEQSAVEQINQLLAVDVFGGCKIRIMPDVHAGAGCVIGFTGDLGERVIPNIVGVDIGCGIYVRPFVCKKDIDWHALNEFILHNIPSGRNHRTGDYAALTDKYMDGYREAKEIVKDLRCNRELKENKRLYKSVGTLGGGNHFIEVDRDEAGMYYLVVHTGSRNLGKQVAQIYQKLAVKCQSGWAELMEVQERMITEYKAAGRKAELQEAIRQLHCSFKTRRPAVPQELSYLEGRYRDDYLNDMRLCQRWARLAHRAGLRRHGDMYGRAVRERTQLHRPGQHHPQGRNSRLRGAAVHHTDEHARRLADMRGQGKRRLELLRSPRGWPPHEPRRGLPHGKTRRLRPVDAGHLHRER